MSTIVEELVKQNPAEDMAPAADGTESEGSATAAPGETPEDKILDAHGHELQNGDSVVVIKYLPVKGAPKPVKSGTKVKKIWLRPGSDHNIDCKIEGFGSMVLKSEFVKKA